MWEHVYLGTTFQLEGFYLLDFQLVWVLGAAVTGITLLLLLLPAFRHRLATLGMISTLLVVGGSIGYCLLVSEWMSGSTTIEETFISYRYPTPLPSRLRVAVGLSEVSIALRPKRIPGKHTAEETPLLLRALARAAGLQKIPSIFKTSSRPKFPLLGHDFEVRASFPLNRLEEEFQEALQHGWSSPILSVLGQTKDLGFSCRQAGRFTSYCLVFALALWAYACVLHVGGLPARCSYALTGTGFLQQLATLIYHGLQTGTKPPLVYHIQGQELSVQYGACFWLCFGIGLTINILGLIIRIFQSWDKDFCSTDLQMDSDKRVTEDHWDDFSYCDEISDENDVTFNEEEEIPSDAENGLHKQDTFSDRQDIEVPS